MDARHGGRRLGDGAGADRGGCGLLGTRVAPDARARELCVRIDEGLEGRRFYTPTERGFEAELGRRLAELRRRFQGA